MLGIGRFRLSQATAEQDFLPPVVLNEPEVTYHAGQGYAGGEQESCKDALTQ